MSDRDHIAINYTTLEEISKIIVNFTLRGMGRNQINVWGVNQYEKKQWIKILKDRGIDVDYLIESKDLIIIEHPKNTSSITPFIMDALQSLKILVEQKDKSGINIIGTFPGNLFLQGKFSDCFEIEKTLHETVETFEIPITMVHLYSLPMTKEQQSSIAEVHNSGLVMLTEKYHILNKKLKDAFENEKIKIDGYQYLESEVFQEKELAIFKAASDMIVLYQEKFNFEKTKKIPHHAKREDSIPKWYFDMVKSLDKLYNDGYADAHKSKEELR
jgi:hypothetical protein